MSADKATARLSLFVRAPRPGFTKTRLIPAIGAEGAAFLYRAFLRDTLHTANSVKGLCTQLCAASDADVSELRSLAPDMPLRVQSEGDLGHRMHHAMATGLMEAERVLIMGSDAPTLPSSVLKEALDALEDADLVLGPALDGGYYLIGVRGRAFDFGDSIRWSTTHTLADTLVRARMLGRRVALLRSWYDVDTPEDLDMLRARLRETADAAPHTRLALAALNERPANSFAPPASPPSPRPELRGL